MKRLAVLLLLLDGMLVPSQVTSLHFSQVSLTNVFWVERCTVRVKCSFAQEHNTKTRPGLEPGPLDAESRALNTRPPRHPLRILLISLVGMQAHWMPSPYPQKYTVTSLTDFPYKCQQMYTHGRKERHLAYQIS